MLKCCTWSSFSVTLNVILTNGLALSFFIIKVHNFLSPFKNQLLPDRWRVKIIFFGFKKWRGKNAWMHASNWASTDSKNIPTNRCLDSNILWEEKKGFCLWVFSEWPCSVKCCSHQDDLFFMGTETESDRKHGGPCLVTAAVWSAHVRLCVRRSVRQLRCTQVSVRNGAKRWEAPLLFSDTCLSLHTSQLWPWQPSTPRGNKC